MENQTQLDREFLEQLQRRYNKELNSLITENALSKRYCLPGCTEAIILSLALTIFNFTVLAEQIRPYVAILTLFPQLIDIITTIALIILTTIEIIVITANIPHPPVTLLYKHNKKKYRQHNRIDTQKYDEELEKVYEKIDDLTMALEKLNTQQHVTTIPPEPKTPSEHVTEDCEHWHQLLSIHIRFIRELELQAAAQGNEFPISKKLELEERHLQVSNLQQRITQNC